MVAEMHEDTMANELNRKRPRYAPPALTVVGSLRGAAESLADHMSDRIEVFGRPVLLNWTDPAGNPATRH